MTISTTLTINTDGAARGNPGPAAAAIVVSNQNHILHTASQYLHTQTNNVAEYHGLKMALDWLTQHTTEQGSPLTVNILMDSQLVVNQTNGLYRIKEPHLQTIATQIQQQLQKLRQQGHHITIQHIPRSQNKQPDQLVNQELDTKGE